MRFVNRAVLRNYRSTKIISKLSFDAFEVRLTFDFTSWAVALVTLSSALLGSVDFTPEWCLITTALFQNGESAVIGRLNTISCTWTVIWLGIVITVSVL
jgi:hypothetical protein